jgi:hypothetical protein
MKLIIIGFCLLIQLLVLPRASFSQDSVVNKRRPFPDTISSFNPHLYLSVGVGYEYPQPGNAVFFTHYELTGGVSCFGRFELVYRYESSANADPYSIQDLNYSSNVWINSLALRYYFVDHFFVSAGAGYAQGITDSLINREELDANSEARFETPVISASVGWSANFFYIEWKEYFGTRQIEAPNINPVKFSEATLGFGLYFRY